jgi:hypothetical protein
MQPFSMLSGEQSDRKSTMVQRLHQVTVLPPPFDMQVVLVFTKRSALLLVLLLLQSSVGYA